MIRHWSPVLFFGTLLIVLVWLLYLFSIAIHVYPPKVSEATHIHRTLYVDNRFSDEEALVITQVAKRWTEATNHIAEIDVAFMPTQIAPVDHSLSIMVLDVSPSFPSVIILDQLNNNSTCGVYNARELEYPVIAVVMERIDDIDLFRKVVMHEVGHALGLEHLKGDENIFTLMYPLTGLMSPGITTRDLVAFCKIYHCDPKSLKDEEKSFHL